MLYMFFAPGFEEVEAIATLDVLRRAKVEVYSVGIGSKTVIGSHNIPVVCDITDSDISFNGVEGIILPGGMPGTLNLEKSPVVRSFIEHCAKENLLLCAICAAPSILGHMGLLQGKKAVCFPGYEADLHGAEVQNAFVCKDGRFITARGMGSSVDFGIKIAAEYIGDEKAAALKGTFQCPQ